MSSAVVGKKPRVLAKPDFSAQIILTVSESLATNSYNGVKKEPPGVVKSIEKSIRPDKRLERSRITRSFSW